MSNPIVYDNATFHAESVQHEGLPEHQASVHTSMYLGWLIESDLVSDPFASESKDLIQQFKSRQITAAKIYAHWDHCLVEDMLNEQGNAFTQAYFDFDRGQFLSDYEQALGAELPSLFHVEDTWDNYDRLKAQIDQRFDAWKGTVVEKEPVEEEPVAATSQQVEAKEVPRDTKPKKKWWQIWK